MLQFEPAPAEEAPEGDAAGGRRTRVRKSLYNNLGNDAFEVGLSGDESGSDHEAREKKRKPQVRPSDAPQHDIIAFTAFMDQ